MTINKRDWEWEWQRGFMPLVWTDDTDNSPKMRETFYLH